MKNKIIAALIAVILCLGIAGCGSQTEEPGSKPGTEKKTADLMTGITLDPTEMTEVEVTDMSVFSEAATDFAIALLRSSISQSDTSTGEISNYDTKGNSENVMVSPISVITALAMTANGAKEETLSQMLSVIGGRQKLEELNGNLKAWTDGLVGNENAKVKIANSIWFKDDENKLLVEESFLEKNAKYYDAGIYKAPFDQDTLSDINQWVSENTDGRIESILDAIPKEAVMYLVNAVTFDAEWQEIYEDSQIWEDAFTNKDMEEKNVEFMHAKESIYLEDSEAAGFMKPYKEGYHFVALLPKEGKTAEEYIRGLTGEHFRTMISEAKTGAAVYTEIPKFEAEYEVELKDILTSMGMEDAFDEKKADFSGIGTSEDGSIYIGRVLHKTYISVDGLGTKAGAATAVEMVTETAMMEEEVYYVSLNRPFVYAVVEDETNIPLFIGVVNDL